MTPRTFLAGTLTSVDVIDPVYPALALALSEWRMFLGAEHVSSGEALLQQAGTATFATTARVQAILRPGSRAEVQDCLRVANQYRIPVYPFSSGKNWGYGSRAPVTDGVLLDLGRLNRITDYNEELAHVTIEPGVTQRQLHEFLQQRGGRLWMDATGASPDCSVIGNTLERGFGHTPMGDHCANACAFEVVLPTGECLNTGFSRFEENKVAGLSRWGVGPALDGIFSQSNLGIVTRMTVWLMPAPEHFEAFFFMCKDEDGLGAVVDALRPLRMEGTLRSVMHIGNDYKVLSAANRYPWDEMGAVTPLHRHAMSRVRERMMIGSWNGSGGLYGTYAQVKEARARLKRALAGKVDRLQFVDDRLLRIMSRFAAPFRWVTGWDVRKTLKVIDPVYNLLKGRPTNAGLATTYWRKRGPIPEHMDPDRDRCGLIWCSPVVPNTGKDVDEVRRLASTILLNYGFEPMISLSLASERMAICVISIAYDRDVEGEDEHAFKCHRTLTEQLLSHGYPPYRLNVRTMNYVDAPGDEYANVLRSLKAALDPNGILAPGRYEPTPR